MAEMNTTYLEANAKPTVSRCNKGRILIVEDDQDTLELMARILGLRGYEVECASSVAEADKIIALTLTGYTLKFANKSKKQPFNLAILDLNLERPGCGGELGRRLMDFVGDINIIVATGNQDALQNLPYTPDAIILKGAGILKLAEIVQQLIEPLRPAAAIPPDAKFFQWYYSSYFQGINSLSIVKEVTSSDEDRKSTRLNSSH